MWDSPRFLNLAALLILTLAVAAFAVGAAAWASRRPMFALKSIRIEPMVVAAVVTQAQSQSRSQPPGQTEAAPSPTFRHVNAATVRAQAIPAIVATTSGNFFTVDLEAVRRAFEGVAWVRRAQVRREWPNRLVVSLEERRVLASWEDGRLVDTFGELFTANTAEAEEDQRELPELAGPDGSERDVAARFVDFRRWFAPLHLVPDQVTLSPRYAWSVHFDNGTDNGLTVDLGRERDRNTVPERVLRMLAAWPLLTARWPQPTLIDLRYPNGFALRAEGLRLADETTLPTARPAGAARRAPARAPASHGAPASNNGSSRPRGARP